MRHLPLLLALLTGPAIAATAPGEETMLGTFTAWQAMRYDEGGSVCTLWTSSRSAGERKANAFVTHRPGAKAYHEVSVRFGVPLAKGSEVSVVIGQQRFTLYVEGDSAWNPSSAEDLRMVQAMRAGVSMEVTARTANGEQITDSYSLSGFTAAHKATNTACDAPYR